MTRSPNLRLLYFKLVLTAVFWGGTFVAGRVISREMGPFLAAFLRFAVATATLTVFLKVTGATPPRLPRRLIIPVLALGFTGVFAYNALFFSGLRSVSAGRASLIIASNPGAIALFAWLLLGERINKLKILGISFSMGGAALVIIRGQQQGFLHGGPGLGELYIIGCVLSWVAYSLVGKLALRELSPLVSVTYACAFGGSALAVPALVEVLSGGLASYSAPVWFSIVYLGVFGSALGFLWYYEGVQIIGPSRAGVFINIVPISSVLLAYFLLGESVDRSIVLGAVLVVAGVFLTNRAALTRE